LNKAYGIIKKLPLFIAETIGLLLYFLQRAILHCMIFTPHFERLHLSCCSLTGSALENPEADFYFSIVNNKVTKEAL